MLTALLLTRLPSPVVTAIYAGRRKVVDGRKIDAKAQALGEMFNTIRVPGQAPSLEQSRAGLRLAAIKFDRPCPGTVDRREVTLPGAAGERPARIYDTRPEAVSRPTLLFVHGGGFIQGDLDTHDGLCGQIADEAGIRVIALDYRLAPEHPFPAAPDDVLAAYRALRERGTDWGVDPERLAVGGDSAGGNLTAVLMHDLAEARLPMPRAQLLIYPLVDARHQTRSAEALHDAYVIPRERMNWYSQLYNREGRDPADPRLSPLLSPHFADQPAACIVAAGHDPLYDDAFLQAKALEQAGVPVTMLDYPGQIHVFVSARAVVPQGYEAIARASAWLKGVLA
jgi:acetyl esterase